MILPDDFLFSQTSLRDFCDCQRRFYLRHVLHLPWPAIVTEPQVEYERHMQRGTLFHRLVHQNIAGLPADKLAQFITDPELDRWWRSFQIFRTQIPEGILLPEYTLQIWLGDHPIIAKYDLIVYTPVGCCLIYDWKTSRNRPASHRLITDLQSRVYNLALSLSGLPQTQGKRIEPNNITFTYWFTEFPFQPEVIKYNPIKAKADLNFILQLVSQIASTKEDQFIMTAEIKRCLFCQYRSMCDRGLKAGNIDSLEDSPEDAYSFSDITLSETSIIAF